MKLEELAAVVSGITKIESAAVTRVLERGLAAIKDKIETGERVRVPGLGTFISKHGKEPGKTRIVFRPWEQKAESASNAQ